MTADNVRLRPGRPEDAAALAELVNHAGEGLPLYQWSKLAAPGESAWDVGRRRARRDEGSFSYRNATVIEDGGRAAACLIGYEIPDDPPPLPPDLPVHGASSCFGVRLSERLPRPGCTPGALIER